MSYLERIGMGSRRLRFASALALAAVCSLGIAPGSRANAPDGAQIVIKDFMFSPTSLTVKSGSTVVWSNKDEEPHTVVSTDGLFRSGAVDTDESYSFKFDKPGTYHFACSIHPRMVGTIVVE